MSKQHSSEFLRLVARAKEKINELTVQEVWGKLERGDKFFFVDVREDSEWSVDHAQGAIHLGRGIIERDIEQVIPDKNAEIILYCGGGFRSALSAVSLQEMGYTRVISMDGGIRVWREEGLPLAQTQVKS